MKKVISLILALVMCLSLCACNGANSENPTHQETDTQTPESKPENQPSQVPEVSLNQKFIVGSYEIEITNVDFVESFLESDGTLRRPTNGDYFIQVDYLAKNIGKEAVYSPLYCMSADYNNGYVFKTERSYRDVSKYNGGVTNPSELQPLSDAVDCRAYISVADEVYTSEKTLAIRITIDTDAEMPEAILYIRK